jgi:hypothetical protein
VTADVVNRSAEQPARAAPAEPFDPFSAAVKAPPSAALFKAALSPGGSVAAPLAGHSRPVPNRTTSFAGSPPAAGPLGRVAVQGESSAARPVPARSASFAPGATRWMAPGGTASTGVPLPGAPQAHQGVTTEAGAKEEARLAAMISKKGAGSSADQKEVQFISQDPLFFS